MKLQYQPALVTPDTLKHFLAAATAGPLEFVLPSRFPALGPVAEIVGDEFALISARSDQLGNGNVGAADRCASAYSKISSI